MSLTKVTDLFKDNEKVALVLVDEASQNITYIGRNHNSAAATSDPSWQIIRVLDTGVSTVIKIEFANSGAFNAVWDNRTSIFPATGPVEPPTAGLDGITPEAYKGFTVTYNGANEIATIQYFADAAKTISLGTLTYTYDGGNNLIGGVFS